MHDVLVVGGGPAGSAAAATLARYGRRVLLVERRSRKAGRLGEALPPAARPLMRDLGGLTELVAGGHLVSYGNASAWGSPELRFTDFVRNPHGDGLQLDRAAFDALLRATAQNAGADVLVGARATLGAGSIRVDCGRREWAVDCRFVVDATGRPSTVSRSAGARRARSDALVAFSLPMRASALRCRDSDSRTLIESCATGWWYTALAPTGDRMVVFLTDEDLADRSELMSIGGFLRRLYETTHVRQAVEAHGYAPLRRPRGADASSAVLDRVAGSNWLATGDAAVALDPLSSQGITNALYTGMQAARAIHSHLDGDGHALPRYRNRLTAIHRAYVRNRAFFYAGEPRWPDQPFWRRRLSTAVNE